MNSVNGQLQDTISITVTKEKFLMHVFGHITDRFEVLMEVNAAKPR
jgi:hypothetical protein